MAAMRTLSIVAVALTLSEAAWSQPDETGFLDRSVIVDGTEYRYQVYVPRGYRPSVSWPVVLALHGGGARGTDGIKPTNNGLGRAIRLHSERFPAIVVFPQSPVEGPGWQDLGGRVALTALDQALEEFNTDKTRVYLTGHSQGGNGSWYLSYHHAERFAAVVVVCGWVGERRGRTSGAFYPAIAPASSADQFATVAQRVSRLPIWIFHGDADTAVPVEQSRRMAAALEAIGANVRYTELPGVGHNAWDQAYEQADLGHREVESR